MATKVRVGVIGTTGIARALHLYVLSRDSRVELAALCGRNQERAQSVAEEYNIPQVFSDYQETANKAYIDAIVISSPVYEHYPMITAALNAGLHVHTQPPLGLNVKQAEEVCAKASESKVRTSVIFNPRLYAPHLYLKQLIDEGYVGTPLFGDFQYLTGRNLSLDEGDWRDDKQRSLGIGQLVIHMADLARWWMDWVSNGEDAGTTRLSLRMESIRIKLDDAPPGYSIVYRACVEENGECKWMNWVSDGEGAGTTGIGKRLEAIRILVIGPRGFRRREPPNPAGADRLI